VGRFGTLTGTAVLIGAAMVHAGCGNNGPIISTTSNAPQVEVFIPDIKGRAAEVAFISVCAEAYGFAHDATKVRAGYLGYESKRGAGPAQLASLEKDYDSTYRAIAELGHRKTSFCATKDGEEVRAELRRFTSGFFEARPSPPAQASADWKKLKGDPDCGSKC
jgi:hypothetical protein